MNKTKNECGNSKSFYRTFVLIYTVLNVVAFFIMLLTTRWSIMTDDATDGISAGIFFMVCGIAAALICGICPALVLHMRGKRGWLYAFPSALLLISVVCAILWRLTESDVYSWVVFICTLPAAPAYNCFVFTGSPFIGFMEHGLVAISPLLYAIVIYFAYQLSYKRALRTEHA